jgi:hypothetical protein
MGSTNNAKTHSKSGVSYIFYKSATTIQRPKSNFHQNNNCIVSYGNLVRAIYSKVKHKECKDHDYILIM